MSGCNVTRLGLTSRAVADAWGSCLDVTQGSREKAARAVALRAGFFFSRPLRTGLTYAAPPGMVLKCVVVCGGASRERRVLGSGSRRRRVKIRTLRKTKSAAPEKDSQRRNVAEGFATRLCAACAGSARPNS